ncbi:MAG: 50S ribosomal protein L11 methyltransferase [Opitutales bacterium]|nr:50S ribosomal protein L11 methyltransferase [Opitutales bacterium]
MIKFTSKIDENTAQQLEAFLEENAMQNYTMEYLPDDDTHLLCGYFETIEQGEEACLELKSVFPNIGEFTQEVLQKTDWVNEYKKHCKCWSFNGFDWVPVWMRDDFQTSGNAVPVYIDSSAAFGTGMHETTRLCAKALELFVAMYERDASLCIKRCLDIGCGTGILGISALKLGLQSATFIDNDEQAIKVCEENVENNGIDNDRVEYVHSDLRVGLLGKQGDLVFANILANVLIENANIIVRSVREGGLLCLSGILVDEMNDVRQVFKKAINRSWNTSFENNVKIGQWGALMFNRA